MDQGIYFPLVVVLFIPISHLNIISIWKIPNISY